MAWVRIDDGWISHPKVQAAGLHGRALFMAGLCYCGQHLTDGRIPKAMLGTLAALAECQPRRAVAALERAGLWHDEGDHWQVHDYLHFNRSREQVEAERHRWATSKRRHRGSMSTVDSYGDSTESPGGSPRSPVPSRPIESQVSPPTQVPSGSAEGGGRALRIASRAAEQQADAANGTITNRAGWLIAARKSILAEHGDRIARLVQQFPQAPDDVLAAAVNGDTHSLRYYAGGEAS